MFGFIQGGDSLGDSIPGRDAVRWMGLGRTLAEPQGTVARVTFDFNADNCGSRIVRKFYGVLELTNPGRFSEREPAQLQLTYHRAGSSQIPFRPALPADLCKAGGMHALRFDHGPPRLSVICHLSAAFWLAICYWLSSIVTGDSE
jgi:hypothetical protein